MRPARALIDLGALRHNYRFARALGGGKAVAVVKADAYGHGAVACARALDGEADAFGVAAIEEALELRAAGIRAPILLLEGFFDADELALIEQHQLWFAVATPWQLEAVVQARPATPFTVWLKLDSGMHRLGLAPAEYAAAAARLQALPHVREVVAMTHFARADELDSDATRAQIALFDATTAALGLTRSLANSPGLLGWDGLRSDWVRPGLMLYGASPFPQPHPQAARLRPVMTLQSQVISVREIAPGEPVGYGAHFVAQRPTRVGVVALGYADGYPQFAPSGTPVAIDGQPGVLIGRVSMDMLTVDLSDHPAADVGSTVELWGAQVALTAVAAAARASAYQLPCALKRAARVYVEG